MRCVAWGLLLALECWHEMCAKRLLLALAHDVCQAIAMQNINIILVVFKADIILVVFTTREISPLELLRERSPSELLREWLPK
jgi:hypothetical protein